LYVPFKLQHMVPAPFRLFRSPGPPVLHASHRFVCACSTRRLIRRFFCRFPLYLGHVLKPAGLPLHSFCFADADDLVVLSMNGRRAVPRSGAAGVNRRFHERSSITLQNSESGNKSGVAGIVQRRVLTGLEENMARRLVLTDFHASEARDWQRRSHGPNHAISGSDWRRISSGTAHSDDQMFRLSTTRPTAEVAWPVLIAVFPILVDAVDVKKGDQLCERATQPSIQPDKIDRPMGS